MWPNTFNRKSATISGWQCLGDFAAVKQQLQKIRASTRAKKAGEECGGCSSSRPLPPLPGQVGGNKSVRFALPEGGTGVLSGSEGSDQGYESDQSRVSPLQLRSFLGLKKGGHLKLKSCVGFEKSVFICS